MTDRVIRCFCLFALVCVLFFFRTATGCAETQGEGTTGIYTLGEIIVTGEQLGVESTATVREITAEDIEAIGARTLDEALELLPGVIIRVGGKGTPRVDIRGFRSRHVLLLLDGIPLRSTEDGDFDPSLIPVENIAKIKISYGNHSVLYGDGGLAGVINIVTKKGTQGVHGSVAGEGGEGDRYLGQGTFSGGSEKVNYFFSGSVFDQRAFPLSHDFHDTSEEDGDYRENSDRERENAFANVGFSPNEEWQFGVVLNYVTGENGVPPSVINDKNDPFAKTPKYDRVDDIEGISGHISAEYDMPGPLEFRSWFFFNEMDEENNRYDDSDYDSKDKKNSYHFDNTTLITGGALQTKYVFDSAGSLTLALNGRREKFESDGWTSTGTDRDYTDEENDLEVYSAALEYEVSPIDKLMLVFGYGHNWLNKDGGDDDDWIALAGASYDLTESTRLKGSAARKIRFPTIRQLYDMDAGNSDLTTERSYNYEAGIEQMLPRSSSVGLTFFYMDMKDYIEKMPVDEDTDMFLNNDHYEFKGFELEAQTRCVENLLLRFAYSYLHSEDKSSGAERDELQYRPEHKITLEGTYFFDFGLTAHVSVNRIADQVTYSNESPLQKKRMNDFTVVSLKLDQAFFDGQFHAYVGVDNLFDEDYEESYALPAEGQFIYAGAKFIF